MEQPGQLQRWADAQQYHAEPQPNATADGVEPSVHLLWMTPDPLGAVAAMSAIYSGKVVRSLADVTDEERHKALEDVQKTHLKAPLEAIKMHFLIEGVDRSFTHQHVRQRTAVYAQESMRFAVLGDLLGATTLPPSLAGTVPRIGLPKDDYATQAQRNRDRWIHAVQELDEAYHYLVENGVPAEEARGLLPHATATRLHYVTDMRNLSDHAGNRLCTQAQFHWRKVFALIKQAIRDYTPDFSWTHLNGQQLEDLRLNWRAHFRWQFQALADTGLLVPVCYQLHYCPFEASFDRACTIRERVQERAAHGAIDSAQWGKPFLYYEDAYDNGKWVGPELKTAEPIRAEEWLLNPAAARMEM